MKTNKTARSMEHRAQSKSFFSMLHAPCSMLILCIIFFLPLVAGSSGINQSLPNVTNDAQTKAAIVPNTAPSAGQVLAGNAGGTAYVPQTIKGDGSLASDGTLAVPKVLSNLLTNSGFGVWSNGALANYGAQLIASWANGSPGYDTLTSSTKDITSAINAAGTSESGSTASIGLTSGHLYQLVATETHTSGAHLALSGTGGVPATTLAAGANTITFVATGSSTVLTVTNTAAASNACTFTLYEVTPGCVGSDTHAMDGWVKNTAIHLYREPNGTNTKAGSYHALKSIPAAQSDYFRFGLNIYNQPAFYSKFAGRTVTFGAWVMSSTANDARLELEDGTQAAYSSYHPGDGAYHWLEVTLAASTSTSEFGVLGIHSNAAPGTAYWSQPMLDLRLIHRGGELPAHTGRDRLAGQGRCPYGFQ